MKKKIAVILFNLGGPSNQQEVKSFLFNLFNDKYIIDLPQPFRFLLAKYISGKRLKQARGIYATMGGGSPILKITKRQATELESILKIQDSSNYYKVFVSMRYTSPVSRETLNEILDFNPDEIRAIPLYPQFSTTTTLSFLSRLEDDIAKLSLSLPIKTIGCYPVQQDFIRAHQKLLRIGIKKMKLLTNDFIILFSAHGLPKKIIDSGDPYEMQIKLSVEKIMYGFLDYHFEYQICYQSKVGRLEWLEPSTIQSIKKAGEQGKSIIIVPIAFTSEHSETLVELDEEYKEYSRIYGVPNYIRIPALSHYHDYISGLAKMVVSLEDKPNGYISSSENKRICKNFYDKCICKDY